MRPYTLFLLIPAFFLSSCLGKKTSDGEEAFAYWAGTEPSEQVKILNGQYWQSPHWTKEYELFLEMQTDSEWVSEFIKQNELELKTSSNFDLPDNAPIWFRPQLGLKAYEPTNFNQGSIYFINEKSGCIIFYEIQL